MGDRVLSLVLRRLRALFRCPTRLPLRAFSSAPNGGSPREAQGGGEAEEQGESQDQAAPCLAEGSCSGGSDPRLLQVRASGAVLRWCLVYKKIQLHCGVEVCTLAGLLGVLR